MITPQSVPDWRDAYVGKTVLITGASGYIGAALAEVLQAVARRLLLLVRDRPAACGYANTTHIVGDLAEVGLWQELGADPDPTSGAIMCQAAVWPRARRCCRDLMQQHVPSYSAAAGQGEPRGPHNNHVSCS